MDSRNNLFISLLCVFAIFFATRLHAQFDNQQQKDSLRRLIAGTEGEEKLKNYKKLSMLYYPEVADDLKMDTLLTVLNELNTEAKKQGDLTLQGETLTTIMNAYLNKSMYDEVIRQAPRHMDYLAKQKVWTSYYRIYQSLFRAHLRSGDHPEALRIAEQMYADANARGDKYGLSLALYSLADVYGRQFREEEQEKYLRQCIELLKGEDKWLNTLTEAYFKLCESLRDQHRPDEALAVADEYEKVIHHYEEYSKFRQVPSWINLYTAYLGIYLEKEDFDKAETYCDKLAEIDKRRDGLFKTFNARARIFNSRKQYDKALEMTDKAMEIARTAEEKNGVRGIKMLILANTGRSQELHELARAAQMVQDSIRNLDFNRQLDELRTQYDLDKAEQQILLRERTIIVVCGIVLLLSIALGIILYLYRKRQIAYRELVQKNLQWAGAGEVPDTDNDEVPDKVSTPSTMDITIMDDIRNRMTRDKIYLRPDLMMDYFAQELGVSVAYISAAVNRCEQKRFNVYINEFRVKEAIHLLSQQANTGKSADEIAEAAGFNDRKSFHRVFKKMTGLSPTDFRRNLQRKG